MIAIAKTDVPEWHATFLRILPLIKREARTAFRQMRFELREELVAQTVASALAAVARLAELGRLDLVYAGPIIRYALQHVRSGRQVGGTMNSNDVTSRCAQLRHSIAIDRLDDVDQDSGQCKAMLVESRTAGPAETAAVRIDFSDWLRTLSARDRRIVVAFVCGCRTTDIARRFRISPARVSQRRNRLRQLWADFVQERGIKPTRG